MAIPPALTAWPISEPSLEARETLSLEGLYDRYADYVYQTLRRVGVPAPALPDAFQDVFIIVHRRLPGLDVCGSVKAWLFVLALGVARNHRRSLRRKWFERGDGRRIDPDLVGGHAEEPFERAAHAEQVELVYKLLESLDDDKRAVFVLAELEQRTVPEIAAILSINLNTAYTRLRVARQKFDQALARFRARENLGGGR